MNGRCNQRKIIAVCTSWEDVENLNLILSRLIEVLSRLIKVLSRLIKVLSRLSHI